MERKEEIDWKTLREIHRSMDCVFNGPGVRPPYPWPRPLTEPPPPRPPRTLSETFKLPLEKDLQAYRYNLPHLLSQEGRFVLIHDGKIIGTFDTYVYALSEGYELFKLNPFFVKQIHATELVEYLR